MGKASSVPLIRYDLAHYGIVTQVISTTSFRAAGLIGHGDGAFQGYNIYVLQKHDNTTTPPHHEQQTCTTYNSATGLFTHVAFTALLAVGDRILLLHPSISISMTPFSGSTIANWEAAESNITTIGTAGVSNKVQSLLLDINALVGNVTIRLYTNINGVQQQIYSETYSVAIDGPGLPIINGTWAINGILLVTAESDDAADNGQAIGWEYILGGA